jgi:hypothetical protein
MADKKPEDERDEERFEPDPLLPDTIINPDGPGEEKMRGITKDWSNHGFSAAFKPPFPYEEGDIIDARCGFRRARAKVVWKRSIMDKEVLVGFKMPPEG